jgi:hypothetical protein
LKTELNTLNQAKRQINRETEQKHHHRSASLLRRLSGACVEKDGPWDQPQSTTRDDGDNYGDSYHQEESG